MLGILQFSELIHKLFEMTVNVFWSFGVEAMKKSVRLGSGKKEQKKLAPKKWTIDRRTFLKVQRSAGQPWERAKYSVRWIPTRSALSAKKPGASEEKWW